MRTQFLIAAVLLSAPLPQAKSLVVSPSGSTSGLGSAASPLDVATAISKVAAGDTVLVTEGTYRLTTQLTIDSANDGTEGKRKCLVPAPGAKPVFDYTGQPYASNSRGVLLQGDWWLIKGIEICHAGDNGMKVEGSHNHIEQCVFHHNRDGGIQLGFAHETVNADGLGCAYNEIVNCDSYMNFDPDTKGGNADGFACKMHNGKGNAFRGCRAWHNSDDGWDLYETDWAVEITDCWSWHNGDQTDFDSIYLALKGTKMSSFSGNGNGIKLGGNGTGGNSKGQHVVTRCVAFNNRFRSLKGFDQNSHTGGIILRNCTAWNNGYNYMFETEAAGSSNEFSNNVSFAAKNATGFEFSAGSVLKGNSWQLGVTAGASDFVDTTEASARAPRQADGSLPDNGFARLAAGSDLIDKGTDIGLSFSGSAPDLGAFETKAGGTTRIGSGTGTTTSLRRHGDRIELSLNLQEAIRLRVRVIGASGQDLSPSRILDLQAGSNRIEIAAGTARSGLVVLERDGHLWRTLPLIRI